MRDLLGQAFAETSLVMLLRQVREGKDGDGILHGPGAVAGRPSPRDPGIQLVWKGIDRPEFLVLEPADGQAFLPLPSLDRTGAAAEVGGNFLPGVEAAGLRPGIRDGARRHLYNFIC
jgi:hypothetical protein